MWSFESRLNARDDLVRYEPGCSERAHESG
jgi:hypothetical protein